MVLCACGVVCGVLSLCVCVCVCVSVCLCLCFCFCLCLCLCLCVCVLVFRAYVQGVRACVCEREKVFVCGVCCVDFVGGVNVDFVVVVVMLTVI